MAQISAWQQVAGIEGITPIEALSGATAGLPHLFRPPSPTGIWILNLPWIWGFTEFEFHICHTRYLTWTKLPSSVSSPVKWGDNNGTYFIALPQKLNEALIH